MADVKRTQYGLGRRYSIEGVDPYSEIEWELRTAQIISASGETIFEQKDVEVPKCWSMTATNIVASKYFHGKLDSPERESSVKHLIDRVVNKIADSGQLQGYFSAGNKQLFADELKAILVNQVASFNSPVWFNVGCEHMEPNAKAANWHYDTDAKVRYSEVGYNRPQCSACFINAVEDSMEGIMRLAHTEAMLFKFGSGTGTNFSSLRSSKEHVSGGGTASGPLSFMKGLDAFAGVIKSGGKTRRAAKMAIMNVDHPDIEEFIDCKRTEEAKAHALIREGYDGSGPDSEAYASIFFQNANNSVRVSDEFMKKAETGNGSGYWPLKGVAEKDRVIKAVRADELLRKIAEATWHCGDPGMQYDDTINKWHTSKNSGRINASNPCSEYMFLDDSACNLASINLIKFLKPNGKFDVDAFKHVCGVMIMAQDILVDMSGYPTEMIARNSHDYRPLGLGYANLGGLLMALGLPYDSPAGRAYAACITSVMCGSAYFMSARIAEAMHPLRPVTKLLKDKEYEATSGACPGWFHNQEPFLEVIKLHHAEALMIPEMPREVPADLREAAVDVWNKAYEVGAKAGFRNSQVTVLAPTGTIGFMMDCDTTGIEPELGLIKYKKLVGGGMIKIVNDMVGKALSKLGYKDPFSTQIIEYIAANGTAEGSGIAPEHLPVFDTSFKAPKSTRSIHWSGHVKMMAATQPFLSGAISKTVNMPEDSTVEEIAAAYAEAWKLGVKAVAIYRDGSKKNQVLVTKKDEPKLTDVPVEKEDVTAPPRAVRHRLPDERDALTHKFNIAGHEGYLTIGLYQNGMPGEIFITMAKEGSTISGLMDAFATTTSVALQHGVPLKTLCEKLSHMRFEPSGWSRSPEIGYAKSIMDYIFRYLEMKYLREEKPKPDLDLPAAEHLADVMEAMAQLGDAPLCQSCGAIMVRNGSCYKCIECGGTSGCS